MKKRREKTANEIFCEARALIMGNPFTGSEVATFDANFDLHVNISKLRSMLGLPDEPAHTIENGKVVCYNYDYYSWPILKAIEYVQSVLYTSVDYAKNNN